MESGDPNKYWYDIKWENLSDYEKQQWQILGWAEVNWKENFPSPVSIFKSWAELTDQETNAADLLGYNSYTWKEIEVAINYAEYASYYTPNKKADVTVKLQSMISIDEPIFVDNYMLGIDPAYLDIKELKVKYTLKNGTYKTKTVEENKELVFD